MKRLSLNVTFILIFSTLMMITGCSSQTQKTMGHGMVSVIAQNVVRIAGTEAMNSADLSMLTDTPCCIKITGFADDFSRGFIENLVKTKAEDAGAGIVDEDRALKIVEVAVNTAGNDQGRSKVPIIAKSERTEGTVDLTLVIRDATTGKRDSVQQVIGRAKYEQSTVLGFQGSGKYYVNRGGEFVKVSDPTSFK